MIGINVVGEISVQFRLIKWLNFENSGDDVSESLRLLPVETSNTIWPCIHSILSDLCECLATYAWRRYCYSCLSVFAGLTVVYSCRAQYGFYSQV